MCSCCYILSCSKYACIEIFLNHRHPTVGYFWHFCFFLQVRMDDQTNLCFWKEIRPSKIVYKKLLSLIQRFAFGLLWSQRIYFYNVCSSHFSIILVHTLLKLDAGTNSKSKEYQGPKIVHQSTALFSSQFTVQFLCRSLNFPACICGLRKNAKIAGNFKKGLKSVPLKKIVTCSSHRLIVPLLWILWQISISYCKFLMPKALKWGILHICNLVIYQEMSKHKYKLLSF